MPCLLDAFEARENIALKTATEARTTTAAAPRAAGVPTAFVISSELVFGDHELGPEEDCWPDWQCLPSLQRRAPASGGITMHEGWDGNMLNDIALIRLDRGVDLLTVSKCSC